MFSSRLDWDLKPNRLTVLLESKRRAGAPILDLTESNPTRAGFSYPAGRILSALADPRSLVYEPLPAGLRKARETAAAYYAARGLAVDPRRILITTSTSESYGYLFKLLADPGDEILAPRPSYPLFEFLAGLESVSIAQYPLVYDGRWSIDFHALEAAAGPRTRAIVVVNPNNPTGSFLKRAELERLVEIAARRNLAMISDEVFADFAFGADEQRVETLAGVEGALAFSLSGLSKIAGLPQMKLGWIVASGPEELRRQALERLELIADTYLSAGTPVQHAFAQLLEAGSEMREAIRRRVRENLEMLCSAITPDSPCRALEVEGGWYATIRAPRTHSEEEWTLRLLEEDNVLVQPGFFFDFESEAYLVLSLLAQPEVFREGTRRLLARIR
jgi:alanine-synthesizing transaminase